MLATKPQTKFLIKSKAVKSLYAMIYTIYLRVFLFRLG